ncbi:PLASMODESMATA CALLOSE-BINDING PROTEIN 4 [Bienertia sinuspersici]
MSVLLFFALFLSLTGYSSGSYCICKDGAQDPTAYQKVIDYACGAGADCKAIQDNGPCYVPDSPKAICDYAVNSYYQNKGQTPEACQFSGAATPSNNLLQVSVPNGCTFPTSGSPTTGGGMGTDGTSTGGTPTSTPGGISTGGGTGTGGMGTGGTGTGMGTPGSSTTGIYSPTGLGPTGSITDMNPSGSPTSFQGTLFLLTLFFFSAFLILWA